MEKKFSELILRIIPLFSAIITIFVFVLQFFGKSENTFLNSRTMLIVVLTVFMTSIIVQTLYTINKNPISITLSIVGFPRVGKTVFLTMLFEELQKRQGNDVRFSPYGNETIERVLKDISTLRNGEWLAKTAINKVFYYRANASIKKMSIFLPRNEQKYKIEIADYAGEHIDEFNPQHDNWLHRTEYFDYVAKSDAIFFALDISKFLNEKEQYRKEVDGIIAALQVLAEKKGAVHDEVVKEPIAILFLKSDLIYQFGVGAEEEILQETDRLLAIGRNRFSSVKSFFVSSTGEISKNGNPSRNLNPTNVVEPLMWLLKRTKITK